MSAPHRGDQLPALPDTRRRVQFAKTPRASLATASSASSRHPLTPQGPVFTPAGHWRRASAAIICGLQSKARRAASWRSLSGKVARRRRQAEARELATYTETHLAARDPASRPLVRKRVKSAPSQKKEPCQPEDKRSRPSTELKNRLRDYQLPISYNNFIVNQLERRFRGKGYEL